MMIKGRAIMHMDGGYKRQFPKDTAWSYRNEDGKWTVTKAGPRYMNIYEVLEFDDAGEQWLIAHLEKEQSEPERFAALDKKVDVQLGWDL